MAWTAATRGDYVRPTGSYASDVTDREWPLIAPLLPAAHFVLGKGRLGCGAPYFACCTAILGARLSPF